MEHKKALLFVQDGSGLGHLSRMCKIAQELQRNGFSVLIVTAKKEALWMIPENCEYIRIPSWKNIRAKSAKHWESPLLINFENADSSNFITEVYKGIEKGYRPDVIINDYLPFGKFNELRSVLDQSKAQKYLVMRGIIDTSDLHIFNGETSLDYIEIYDKIFVANDPKVFDFLNEYDFTELLRNKVEYVGYVSPARVNKASIRHKFNIPANKKWVVCSAGGGINAEDYLRACLLLPSLFENVEFDIVLGPYSKISVSEIKDLESNCRLHQTFNSLYELTSSADVNIINGGYNSLVESAYGGAKVIVYPNNTDENDEQLIHTREIAKYHPVYLLKNLDNMASQLAAVLTVGTQQPAKLIYEGQVKIVHLIKDYLTAQ